MIEDRCREDVQKSMGKDEQKILQVLPYLLRYVHTQQGQTMTLINE